MKDLRILDTMTIAEASAFLAPDQHSLLKRWAETFGVALRDFHDGHIKTYQHDRLQEAPAYIVDGEVEALIQLLTQQGLGELIVRNYRPLADAFPLTETELHALPPRAHLYIKSLQREIDGLKVTNERQKNQIRKTNWGRSR